MSNQLESEDRARAEGMLMGYLEVVCISASLAEYESTRQELSGHLIELANAYEEIGLSPADAMRAAIAKLGPAKQLGQAIVSAEPTLATDYRALMPVACGALTGLATMSLLESEFVKWGWWMYSPNASVWGLTLGLVCSFLVVRSNRSLQERVLLAGLLCGPGFVSAILCLHIQPFAPSFAPAVSLLLGICGMVSALSAVFASRVKGFVLTPRRAHS